MTTAGCADTNKGPTTQPLTLEQRNQKVIDDPMNAGPNEDPSYLSQHGLGGSDKPTMKKDIDNFWILELPENFLVKLPGSSRLI